MTSVDMSTSIVPSGKSIFLDANAFEFAQRVANVFAKSTMVPDHFKNNIGNCLIALNYAARINADPFMVLQNLYVVHGRPGIEGKLVIALVNQSGRFEPLEFEEDDDGCLAFAKEKRSGKVLKGPKVTWAMVKAEGWLSKSGSKWQTMAPIMFRYRSATYFARTFCPEVLLGMATKDELEDYITLQPAKNGKSWEPEPPAPDFDIDAFRKNLIENEDFAEADIDAFEKKLAEHYQKPIEEVRQEIGNDTAGFVKSLQAWTKKNGTPHPPTQGEASPEDPIRAEFINLKSAGLATWVHKNLERISASSDEIQTELREKWGKLYAENPFPLDKQNNPEPGNQKPAETTEAESWIECPITEMRVNVKDCRECEKDCQVYEEWKMQNEE